MPEIAEPPTSSASPAERKVALLKRGLYPYFDGVRDRLGDIIAIQMRMQKALPRGDMDHLDQLLTAAAGPAPASTPSEEGQEPVVDDAPSAPTEPVANNAPPPLSSFEALVELARVIGLGFELPPLDEMTGAGLSVQERADLLGDFLASGVEGEGDDPAGPDSTESETTSGQDYASQLAVPTAPDPAAATP